MKINITIIVAAILITGLLASTTTAQKFFFSNCETVLIAEMNAAETPAEFKAACEKASPDNPALDNTCKRWDMASMLEVIAAETPEEIMVAKENCRNGSNAQTEANARMKS